MITRSGVDAVMSRRAFWLFYVVALVVWTLANTLAAKPASAQADEHLTTQHWYSPTLTAAPRTRTLQGYRAASASRSCLTGDTRAVLAALEARVGAVQLVSTCRPGAVIAGTRSPSFHRYGKAVDFNTRNKAAAIAFLRTQRVFVMTYCGMSHVHFNTGQQGVSFCGARGYAKYRYKRRPYRR